MSDKMKATAKALVENCRSGKEMEGLDTLYRPDAVSVEAAPGPDGNPVSEGVDAIKGKHEWWNAAFELHDASVDGPFYHGDDRFSVIFGMEATEKETGQRIEMKEVAVYTTDPDGLIIREEFFYDTDGGA